MYSKSDLLKMILENDSGAGANNASALEKTVGNLTISANEAQQTQSGSLNLILKKQLRNENSTIIGQHTLGLQNQGQAAGTARNAIFARDFSRNSVQFISTADKLSSSGNQQHISHIAGGDKRKRNAAKNLNESFLNHSIDPKRERNINNIRHRNLTLDQPSESSKLSTNFKQTGQMLTESSRLSKTNQGTTETDVKTVGENAATQ